MSLLWSYLWPILAAGLVAGAVAGLVAFRRGKAAPILFGIAAAVAAAAVWHGPLGAGDRFAGAVERTARASLDYYEMTKVSGRLQRDPLSRNLRLAGPADEFQRSELARVMSDLPGVRRAVWSQSRGLPLLAEALAAALVGFLAGLLLAYGVHLHRRYNAQWDW